MSPFRDYATDRSRLFDLKTIDAYGAESVNALIKKTGGTALHKKTQGESEARIFLAQRRKDAKKTSENAAALCVFAPLRERYPRQRLTPFFCNLFVLCVSVSCGAN